MAGPCLCGNPESVIRFVHRALTLIKARSEAKGSVHTAAANAELEGHFPSRKEATGLYWMVWYFIDKGGVLEHGGSVNGSWLTDKGRAFLEFLDEHARYDYQVLEDPMAWDMGVDSKNPALATHDA